MRRVPSLWLLLLGVAATGSMGACGHKIGDSCNTSSDCSQDGTRVCDTVSPGGLCTIQGCDFGTCPDEAVCVRFFPAIENARSCETQPCAPDEVCTVDKQCAPRSIEQRFCMLTCGGDGDCREQYECRDVTAMNAAAMHGGEPVPDPETGEIPSGGFCASRRACSLQTDCDVGEVCDPKSRICQPG